MSKVRFGVTHIPFITDFGLIQDIALQCENLGYYSLWSDDHPLAGTYASLDCFTLLTALSRETKKIRLGPLVACNSYRSPALTAKIGSTLDIVSEGRFMLGYGAGWAQIEYEGLGYPFPRTRTRIGQMREGIMIIKRLWTEDTVSFDGEFYRTKDASCAPKPVQKPHPPIIIGGRRESIIRAAAEIGDGWNVWKPRGTSTKKYKEKVDLLAKYCDEFGRRIENIEQSLTCDVVLGEDTRQIKREIEKAVERYPPWAGRSIEWLQAEILGGGCTYGQCIEVLQEYVDLGCRHFIFNILTFNEQKEAFMEKVGSSF